MDEELYQKITEAQMMTIRGLGHSHREKEEENPQEADIEKTMNILQEIIEEISPEIQERITEDNQETETETEDMKTEAAAEKGIMMMKGQQGPAMVGRADPEMVARSP